MSWAHSNRVSTVWTPETQELVLDLAGKGLPSTVIAREVGLTKTKSSAGHIEIILALSESPIASVAAITTARQRWTDCRSCTTRWTPY
jgi:hypothetical protein